MFKTKAFWARLCRLVGAALVISTGYFIYMDTELNYTHATIINYEQQHPIIKFSGTDNAQITYKMTEVFNPDQHPIGSELQIRFPKDNYLQLEYFSPLLQWAFYIVLFIGLIIFFIGAVLTLQIRKQLKK